MARLKILLDEPRRNEQRSRESQSFLEHLDEALRKSSGGREWAVQGASRTIRDEETGVIRRRRVYLCEVGDVENRWPLVKELIHSFDLEDRVTAYREERLHTGWEKLWAKTADSG